MKTPTRADARKRWALVAAGQLDDPAMRDWLADVARRILEADDTSTDDGGNARVLAIQKAVGLTGSKRDTGTEARDLALLSTLAKSTPALFVGRVDATEAEARGALRQIAVDLLGLPREWLDSPAGRERIDARYRNARAQAKK